MDKFAIKNKQTAISVMQLLEKNVTNKPKFDLIEKILLSNNFEIIGKDISLGTKPEIAHGLKAFEKLGLALSDQIEIIHLGDKIQTDVNFALNLDKELKNLTLVPTANLFFLIYFIITKQGRP